MKKTDNYTKGVLSLIAFCLLLLTVHQLKLFPVAHAAELSTFPDASVNYGLVPLNADGSINVRMETMDVRIVGISTYDDLRVSIEDINTSDMLSVDIRNVNTSDELLVNISDISTTDKLDVNIEEIGGSSLFMCDPIPVKIKE